VTDSPVTGSPGDGSPGGGSPSGGGPGGGGPGGGGPGGGEVAWDRAAFRAQVQTALEAFLDEHAEWLAPLGDDSARLLAEARALVSGGKRFRAAFCYWGYRAVAGTPYDESTDGALVRACASLELLHASALVHDDYMDASDTRRGRPATHRSFAAEHRRDGWRGDPEQYGASAAILLGDLLLSWSDELLRRCGLPTERVVEALDVFDRCRSEVITGQFLDVSVQARGVADVDTAMTVLRYKSAKYSIERPLHIGATLAGARPDQLARLSAFGLPLGEAFQLRDDLLGVFGDPATTGKPAGDDLVEGKRTVLVALALDGASAADAARLDGALGTPLTDADVAELRRIIDDSGAHEQVEQVIGQLAAKATAALAESDLDPHARGVLLQLATAATVRAV
jgi:geranylgeranyl diphosphate synthase type I